MGLPLPKPPLPPEDRIEDEKRLGVMTDAGRAVVPPGRKSKLKPEPQPPPSAQTRRAMDKVERAAAAAAAAAAASGAPPEEAAAAVEEARAAADAPILRDPTSVRPLSFFLLPFF